ncbi:MAG: hypothetical protein AAFU65_06145 [Pseudomonadota bacterium]
MIKPATSTLAAAVLLSLALGAPMAQAASDGATPAQDDAQTTVKQDTAEPAAKADAAPVQRKIVFQSQESLSFKQKIQIYNRSKDEAEQLYCREDRMTGSHRKRMRCVTNETRQLEEDSARLFFDSLGRG